MKLFLDTAHLASIKKWADSGLIDGITTNPTHLSKETGLPSEIVKQICVVLPEGEISVEVTEKTSEAVYEQAKKIAALSENVIVKIPCYSGYIPIIKKLVDEGVGINITLVFSAMQALMLAKLGVMYVSPFIGRLDDIDSDGIQLIADIREMFETYDFETEILAASLRSVRQVHQVALLGAHVATIPVEIFEKLLLHPLTEKGMATFDADWQKLGVKHFP